jgi:hypothetical protein
VPAVLVTFPLAARRWARPVRVDLYRTPAVRTAGGDRHRTPARPMGRLLRPVLLRCPGRTFALAGDSGFGTHEVARFCRRHRDRLGPVGQCHPDLDLFAPPPPYPGPGRPRVKGGRVPKPREAAGTARRTRPAVTWYGAVAWPGKATVTFSDAMCAARRWLWNEAVLPRAGDGTALQELPEPIRELLLTTLAPAA